MCPRSRTHRRLDSPRIIFAAERSVVSFGSCSLYGFTRSVFRGFHVYVSASASTMTTLFMSRGKKFKRCTKRSSSEVCTATHDWDSHAYLDKLSVAKEHVLAT